MRKKLQNHKLLLLNIIPIVLSILSALAAGLTVNKVSELTKKVRQKKLLLRK